MAIKPSPQFYHGSDHEFNDGDTVEPRDNFAWASTNRGVASEYGKNLYVVEPIDDVKRVKAAAKEFGIYASRTGFRVVKRHEDE